MTPAEKMAKTLDSVSCNLDGEYRDDITEDAAALIRRLAAALLDSYNFVPTHIQVQLNLLHADALRDVKEQA